MPDFSFRFPRFIRSHRSRRSHSPQPSPAGARDDAANPHSPYLSPGTPSQDVHAIGTSRSPASSNLTHLQHTMAHPCVNRSLGGPSGQPSQVSPPITPINVVDPNFASTPSPQDLAAKPPVHLPHLRDFMDSNQSQQPPLSRLPSCSFATPSQQFLGPERRSTPSEEDTLPLHHQNQEMFKNAHSFTMTRPNFIEHKGKFKVTNNFSTPKNFMKDLLQETIPGAASDSSARYPPPRCHPGTRLAILERCLYFIAHCDGQKKMRWVVGAAGVGKSAIMQSVADSPELPVTSKASVFFFINGRNDGTKAIMTLSYQFAAKSKLYRQIIEDGVTDDPSLLHSSMPVQFEKFIVQPFIHNPDLSSAGRVLIIIDGLDECKDTSTQVDLLRLVSSFCVSYPSSPIVWLIASRPEAHITSFFSRSEVMPVYEKEEIAVDSDEARADVERLLREKLTEIGMASDSLDPHWPNEQDLWKLAKAAGGLFAYAHTVIRYIDDSAVGDPVSQLSEVLNVIDNQSMTDVPQEEHPMALLDALYARILSNVPRKIMINTRKLLLALASGWDFAFGLRSAGRTFIVLCNWLGMTADEAYAAVNRLRSVLNFPKRHDAHKEALKPFHKSFIDYLFRSGFSPDLKLEARQLMIQCAFRVLKDTPSALDFGRDNGYFYYGRLARNNSDGGTILITWPTDEGIVWKDDQTRLVMYKLAIGEVAAGVERGDPVFQSESWIKMLATRFENYYKEFPHNEFLNLVLDKSRRHEFMKHGILTQIPVKEVDISEISSRWLVRLQFHRPVTTTLPDPWNPSCKHERDGQWEEGKEQNWATTFDQSKCSFCFDRFKRQVKDWRIQSPDDVITIMFTTAAACGVELRFVDPEDNVSELIYWSWIYFSPGKRKRLGSTL